MAKINDNWIKSLAKRGENDTIEFKSFEKLHKADENGKKNLAKLFAAFANSKGGTVYFGLTDDGNLENRNLTKTEASKYEQLLIQIADTLIKPSLYLENIELLELDGNTHLLKIEIPPRKKMPHNVAGVFYKRIGSHNIPITNPSYLEEMFVKKDIFQTAAEEKEVRIDLNEISEDLPRLQINRFETPLLTIKSRDSHGCLLFGEGFGYSDGAHYVETLISGAPIGEIKRILETFYAIFGASFIFYDPVFMITQVCYEKYTGHSWFGYGPINFIKALEEQGRRYSEAGIKSPHHREAAGYVDYRDNFIFFIGLQPNLRKDNLDRGADYLKVGFVFETIPFDNRKFIDFFDKIGLGTPNFINYDKNLSFKYLNLRGKKIRLENTGRVVYKIREDEEWVSRIICKNPFYNPRTRYPVRSLKSYLSEHEKIIVSLSDHHTIDENPLYFLEDIRIIPIPYFNFDFAILNIHGNW